LRSTAQSLLRSAVDGLVQFPAFGQAANSQFGATRPTDEPSGHCLASAVQTTSVFGTLTWSVSEQLAVLAQVKV